MPDLPVLEGCSFVDTATVGGVWKALGAASALREGNEVARDHCGRPLTWVLTLANVAQACDEERRIVFGSTERPSSPFGPTVAQAKRGRRGDGDPGHGPKDTPEEEWLVGRAP